VQINLRIARKGKGEVGNQEKGDGKSGLIIE